MATVSIEEVRRDLEIGMAGLDELDPDTDFLCGGNLVRHGEAARRHILIGRAQQPLAEDLGRLHAPEVLAAHSFRAEAGRVGPFHRLGGAAGEGGRTVFDGGGHAAVDVLRGNQGPRAIVHRHLERVARDGGQSEGDRVMAVRAAIDPNHRFTEGVSF